MNGYIEAFQFIESRWHSTADAPGERNIVIVEVVFNGTLDQLAAHLEKLKRSEPPPPPDVDGIR